MNLPRTENSPEDLPMGDAATRSEHTVDLLEQRELISASDVLARAFRDNPLNRAVIRAGPRRRYRSNLAGMRGLLEVSFGGALLLGVRDAGVLAGHPGAHSLPPSGVLIGARPFGYPLPGPSFAGYLRSLIGQGPRTLGRWARVYRALEAAHPLEPHWYLAVLGIAPEHQRSGNGAALLRAFVEKVDASGEPSYLETDRHENIAFYAREGYEVEREVTVLDVPVWCMWRPARPREEGRGAV